jgi:hypothetical protein
MDVLHVSIIVVLSWPSIMFEVDFSFPAAAALGRKGRYGSKVQEEGGCVRG